MASYIDKKPEVAPWGGYPRPTILIGGSKSDLEMKVLEYWARECGCAFYPLDWCLDPVAEWAHPIPDRWWDTIKEHWDEMIEPNRLAARIEEEKGLVNYLESTTSKRLTIPRLLRSLELLNEQMIYWGKARDLIAETVPCPVMWHRGTVKGLDLIKAYYEEVKYRVEKNTAACPNEKLRLSWAGDHSPIFESYIEEKYGAVIVAWGFFSLPIDSYYRRIDYDNPMKTLAAHHMTLFNNDANFFLRDAKMAKCDGRIEIRRQEDVASFNKPVFEQAGIPVCELPRESLDTDVKSMLDKFIEGILYKKGKFA
jgi:benzoyl-CoA reductase subunit B